MQAEVCARVEKIWMVLKVRLDDKGSADFGKAAGRKDGWILQVDGADESRSWTHEESSAYEG